MIAIILWLADFYYNIPRRGALQPWEQRENRNYEQDLNSHLAPLEPVFDDLNFFSLTNILQFKVSGKIVVFLLRFSLEHNNG